MSEPHKFLTLKECLLEEMLPIVEAQKNPSYASELLMKKQQRIAARMQEDEAFNLLLKGAVGAFLEATRKFGTVSDTDILFSMATLLLHWEDAHERFNKQLKSKPE